MMLTKVHRPALGFFAALTVTVGMLAAPVAGSAHAKSVSLNTDVLRQCTAPDWSRGRGSTEEIPQTTVRVADWCRAEAVNHAGTAVDGGVSGGVLGDGAKPGTASGSNHDGSKPGVGSGPNRDGFKSGIVSGSNRAGSKPGGAGDGSPVDGALPGGVTSDGALGGGVVSDGSKPSVIRSASADGRAAGASGTNF